MSVTSNFDLDSVGGGYGMGGLGGNGNLPLWLLLFLGLGKNGGLFGNNDQAAQSFSDGATQSKLDCLSQNQGNLAEMIRQQSDNFRFDALNGQISELSAIQRDALAAITGQNNALAQQLAECCCEVRTGQQAIRTDIAMQTNQIERSICDGNQRIADMLTQNTLESKNDRIRELEQQAQTAALATIIRDQCGGKNS